MLGRSFMMNYVGPVVFAVLLSSSVWLDELGKHDELSFISTERKDNTENEKYRNEYTSRRYTERIIRSE